jgi:CMP-N-acetylneuraminic acid synthetase
MNILGLITARGGSKGIPKKNIKFLGGVPLIAYTIDVAKKSKLINDLILSTDNQEIADVSKSYGLPIPFLRPKELAADDTPHYLVIQHAVKFMEHMNRVTYDYVVLLQPTSPFRLVEDIDITINKLINSDADSAVTMVQINDNHPLKAKKIVNGIVEPFFCEYPEPEGMPRQKLPIAYKRSGAVYVMKRNIIMDNNSMFGKKITCHVVPENRSIDIDTNKDWAVAEYMLNNLIKDGLTFFNKNES